MHSYYRNIGDYAKDTRHLSLLEHGIFNLLIDTYYTNETPLPSDVAQVARRLGARSQEEIAAVEAVLNDFFTLESDGWHQTRCDQEIALYHANNEKQKENGKKGGRPPKSKTTEKNPYETQNNPVVMVGLLNDDEKKPTGSENSTFENPKKPKPETINHKPLTINQNKEEREEIAVLTASEPEANAPTFSQAENFNPAKPESLPTTNRPQVEPPQTKFTMEARSLTAELHRDTAKRVPGFTPKFSNYADETAIAELLGNGATADQIRKVWAFATSKPFWAGKIATPKDLTRHWVALCQESASAKPPTASQQQAMRNGKPIIDREGWTAAPGEGWYTSWGTKEGWHDGKMYENDCEMMGVAA